MSKKENILISACFLGTNCRYDGRTVELSSLDQLKKKYNLIPICPEIIGGLETPRKPAEIRNNKVINSLGQDVTNNFEIGAREALKLAKLNKCRYAILKERSPSCGYGKIYDGTFSGTLIGGNGVTAELLAQNGIIVLGESQISKLLN